MKKVTSFGEVLWDNFDTGKILGGAPLNVAVRLSQFGLDVAMISRVGKDADGEAILQQIRTKNVKTQWIQTDEKLPTSLVNVSLDEKGSASYEIVYPCAWDNIAIDEQALQRVAESDAFVFGSLAVRDQTSLAALQRYLAVAKFKIFDVNLRAPFYQQDILLDLMKQSDMLKLNDEELHLMAKWFDSKHHCIEQNIRFIAKLTGAKVICVTLGQHGAILFKDNEFVYHGGFWVQVVDTVGAGDNFLGTLIAQLLHDSPPKTALTLACAVGAMVAARHGATPDITLPEIEQFMN